MVQLYVWLTAEEADFTLLLAGDHFLFCLNVLSNLILNLSSIKYLRMLYIEYLLLHYVGVSIFYLERGKGNSLHMFTLLGHMMQRTALSWSTD